MALRWPTLIIQQIFTWKQMPAIAGLSLRRFYFRSSPGAIRSKEFVAFLAALHTTIGRKLLIIRVGGGTHGSRLVRAWLEPQEGRIAIAFLPPYAPKCNPLEATWTYLKKNEIVRLCLTTVAQVNDVARQRLTSMQRPPNLVRAF